MGGSDGLGRQEGGHGRALRGQSGALVCAGGGMAAYQLLRMPISALVALAPVGSPRKGLGSCPLQQCVMLGKPRGKLGSHSVHAHTTCRP